MPYKRLNKSRRLNKSNKKLRGGMIRSGSVQHFRTGNRKSISKKRKLRGGMIRSGSVQHFRTKQNGSGFLFGKSKEIKALKNKLKN